MTIIHVGDGRHIELKEGLIFGPPPPPPKPKKPRYNNNASQPHRPPKYERPESRGANNVVNKKIAEQQGFAEFWSFKNEIIGRYADRGVKSGGAWGVRKKRLGYYWGWAKRRVKKDMAKIQKVHPDLDDMAKEALEGALMVLRGPQNQGMKLQAAKLLLEFTKSKPVAKSEVSVNAAEAWLASLGKEDSDT